MTPNLKFEVVVLWALAAAGVLMIMATCGPIDADGAPADWTVGAKE